MARKSKKKKKRGWFKLFLLFVVTPVVIWAIAFVAWFYWRDMGDFAGLGKGKTETQRTQKSAAEKIFEEDRKKLDEILKKGKK